jgi:signal transduction histidine kinase
MSSYLHNEDDELERPISNLMPIVAIVAALATCVYFGTQSGNLESGPSKLAAIAFCIIAESLSPATAALGFVPWAIPGYFLLATSTASVAPSLFLLLPFALIVRTAIRGKAINERLVELASDLVCGVFLLLMCRWLGPAKNPGPPKQALEYLNWALPLAAYWLLWTVLPSVFLGALSTTTHKRWSLARERVHSTVAFLLGFGLLLALGLRDSSVLYIAPLILLLCLSPAAAQAQLWKLEDDQRQNKSSQALLRKEQATLVLEEERIQARAKQTLAEEQSVLNQKQVFESVGGLFAEVTRAWGDGFSRQILGTVRQRIPCKTMVLFARKSNQWLRVSSHGSQVDRFDLVLSELDRTLIGEALRSQTTILRAPGQRGILDPQEHALAIPIDRWGVFYVGDRTPDILEKNAELLKQLAPHLRIYVDAANYYEHQQSALESEAELRKKTEDVARRLALVLQSLSNLVGETEPDGLLSESLQQISQLVQCHSAALIWSSQDGDKFRRVHPDTPETWSELSAVTAGWEALEEKTWGRHTIPAPPAIPGRNEGTNRPTSVQLPTLTAWHALPMNNGMLLLVERPNQMLVDADLEVLRLFVWQAERLLENASLFWELQRAHQELQASQAQLVQSSKLAAIGQLAAGVAHELNTPLGAISVAIDGAMMAMDAKPERSKQRLEKAILSIEQMQAIISKLLFYSRESRSGRQEIDINKVIESSVQLVGHLLELENFSIEMDLGEGNFVLANPNELQQVFTNLLINAKDACLSIGASARRVRIRSTSDAQHVLIQVQDWGAGMDDATAQRIFEPFFTTKPVGQGTGLGLSTSLLLIEEHQGELTVQSSPGKGATFTISLPKSRNL